MFKKTYLFLTLLTALLLGGTGSVWGADETLTIYETNTTTNYYVPVYGSWLDADQHNQFIIPASDLTNLQGGTIKGLKFHLSSLGSWSSGGSAQPTVVVSVAEVDETQLSALNTTATLHEVYSGSMNMANKAWTITFPSDKYYTYGNKNLLVDVVATAGGKYITTTWIGKAVSGAAFSYNGVRGFLPRTTFTYAPAPVSCAKPSELKKTVVSTNSATFTWVKGDKETSWQYICLPADDELDWSDANVQVATSATATVNGLTANTEYKFYLRAYCNATDQSADVIKAFRTPCVGYSTADLPYEKNFNDMTNGTYPDCWTKVEFVSGSSFPIIYGSNGESGSKSMRFYGGVTSTSEQIAILPPFEEATGNLLLSLWYKNGNASSSYGQFIIGYITDPEDASTFQQIGDPLTRNSSGAEVNKFAMTGAPANSLIAIKYAGGSSAQSAYIDNVKVSLPSSCTDPSDVNAVAASATSATVSWTENGSATTWNLQYSTDNFATHTDFNDITTNPYPLAGLTPNTTYKVRVQAACEGGDKSDWITSAAFTTPCEAVNGIGWSENFETATAGSGKIPGCWQKNTNNNSYPNVNSTSTYQKTGSTKCLYFYGGTSTSVQIAILPPFSEETNTLYVTLDYSQGYYDSYWGQTDYSTSEYGQLAVGYMTDPADASSFVAKETLPRVSSYTSASVALTGAPANSYVAIRYAGGSTSGEVYVDNIVISSIPSCLAPSGVNGSATASDKISVSWTANSGESAWKIQYSSDNGENWSAEIAANTNPFTLTELSANTDYIVQVKALCGGEDVSGWSASSAPIHTPCGAADASDYSENMENSAINIGNLPDCWQYREKYSSGYPYVYSGSSYAYAGNNSLYFYGGVDESSEQSVLLPAMDEALNGLTLEFYYKDAESGWYTNAKFTVGYIAADGTTFVPIETLNYADSYTKYTKDLAALPNDAKCLAIRFAGGESTAYGYIDNVRVYPTPSCLAPSGVTVTNVTATTADVDWTENNGATTWNLQISNDGTNWTNVNGAITKPYQLTGLNANHTTYYVRVNSVCGGTDASPYSDPSAPFYTECGTVSLPFSENFSAAIPCWKTEDCVSGTGIFNDSYYTGGNPTFRFYYGYSPQYLITPEINTGGKQVTVAFDYFPYSSYYAETFKVGYSTTTNEVSAFTWGAEQTPTNSGYTNPVTYSENLPADVKYVAIQYTAIDQYYLYIENFSVTEYVAPACPAVNAATLEASDVTAHTATVSWTAGGEETAWNLQYKAVGGEWSDVIAISTTPSYDFENLAENTLYYVKVQADCAGDGTGDWTGDEAFSFRTECEPKAISKESPWNCGFEESEGIAVNTVPSCWDELPEGHDNYTYALVANYYSKTGDQCLEMEAYSKETKVAVLPVFNQEIKNLQIAFAYNNNNTNSKYGRLELGYVSGEAFTRVGDFYALTNGYASVPAVEMPADAPEGARIAFRIKGITSYYYSMAYLDDIVVSLKPTCYTPTALAAEATSDGAQLTWTAGKNETEWNVRYSVKAADSWTVVEEIDANNYTLTDLTAGTTYEVQVRAYCGENDESEWSASVEFTPECNAPTALAVTARTNNSATFSWTSSESAWLLQYSVDGENWESENVTTNPFTLEGLAAGTTYQAKIQSACGGDFTNVVEFTTWCAAISELPLNEDFENVAVNALPSCWEKISDGEYPSVVQGGASYEGENGKCLCFFGVGTQILVLPAYNVELANHTLSFFYKSSNATLELGYINNEGGFELLQALDAQSAYGDDAHTYALTNSLMNKNLAFRYVGTNALNSHAYLDVVRISKPIVLADNVDNSEIIGANMNKTVDVTIGRTFTRNYGEDTNPDHYNTICLPFSLSAEELAASPIASNDLWAFKYAKVDEATNELQFRIVEADHIEAGKPYFIGFPANEENIVNPLFKNVTITASAGQNVGDDVAQLCGILKPETFYKGDQKKLFLYTQTNTLYWWNGSENSQLYGFRAFFYVPGNTDSQGAPIRFNMSARIVKEEQTATGIENATLNENGTMKVLENNQVVIIRNGVKYTLQGQKIQ